MKTRGITRHQEAEFRHAVKLPDERKAQQVFPESWEEVWKGKRLFNLICPRMNPSLNHTSKKIRGVVNDASPLTSTNASLHSQPEEGCQRNTKQPTFFIFNY